MGESGDTDYARVAAEIVKNDMVEDREAYCRLAHDRTPLSDTGRRHPREFVYLIRQ